METSTEHSAVQDKRGKDASSHAMQVYERD